MYGLSMSNRRATNFFNGSEVGRLHRIGKLDPFASVRALPTGIKCGRHESSVTDTRTHTFNTALLPRPACFLIISS